MLKNSTTTTGKELQKNKSILFVEQDMAAVKIELDKLKNDAEPTITKYYTDDGGIGYKGLLEYYQWMLRHPDLT